MLAGNAARLATILVWVAYGFAMWERYFQIENPEMEALSVSVIFGTTSLYEY